ncbi:hypothetical protein BGZ51_000951 [Haplosporangium sp. Z 767]|nr:hypothetical protein BGZ51_000951 [Haplosporangium sp. Z 767]
MSTVSNSNSNSDEDYSCDNDSDSKNEDENNFVASKELSSFLHQHVHQQQKQQQKQRQQLESERQAQQQIQLRLLMQQHRRLRAEHQQRLKKNQRPTHQEAINEQEGEDADEGGDEDEDEDDDDDVPNTDAPRKESQGIIIHRSPVHRPRSDSSWMSSAPTPTPTATSTSSNAPASASASASTSSASISTAGAAAAIITTSASTSTSTSTSTRPRKYNKSKTKTAASTATANGAPKRQYKKTILRQQAALLAAQIKEENEIRDSEATRRVLARTGVIKHLRSLKSRLALAQYKVQNGWQEQPLPLVTELFEEKLEESAFSDHGHENLPTNQPSFDESIQSAVETISASSEPKQLQEIVSGSTQRVCQQEAFTTEYSPRSILSTAEQNIPCEESDSHLHDPNTLTEDSEETDSDDGIFNTPCRSRDPRAHSRLSSRFGRQLSSAHSNALHTLSTHQSLSVGQKMPTGGNEYPRALARPGMLMSDRSKLEYKSSVSVSRNQTTHMRELGVVKPHIDTAAAVSLTQEALRFQQKRQLEELQQRQRQQLQELQKVQQEQQEALEKAHVQQAILKSTLGKVARHSTSGSRQRPHLTKVHSSLDKENRNPFYIEASSSDKEGRHDQSSDHRRQYQQQHASQLPRFDSPSPPPDHVPRDVPPPAPPRLSYSRNSSSPSPFIRNKMARLPSTDNAIDSRQDHEAGLQKIRPQTSLHRLEQRQQQQQKLQRNRQMEQALFQKQRQLEDQQQHKRKQLLQHLVQQQVQESKQRQPDDLRHSVQSSPSASSRKVSAPVASISSTPKKKKPLNPVQKAPSTENILASVRSTHSGVRSTLVSASLPALSTAKNVLLGSRLVREAMQDKENFTSLQLPFRRKERFTPPSHQSPNVGHASLPMSFKKQRLDSLLPAKENAQPVLLSRQALVNATSTPARSSPVPKAIPSSTVTSLSQPLVSQPCTPSTDFAAALLSSSPIVARSTSLPQEDSLQTNSEYLNCFSQWMSDLGNEDAGGITLNSAHQPVPGLNTSLPKGIVSESKGDKDTVHGDDLEDDTGQSEQEGGTELDETEMDQLLYSEIGDDYGTYGGHGIANTSGSECGFQDLASDPLTADLYDWFPDATQGHSSLPVSVASFPAEEQHLTLLSTDPILSSSPTELSQGLDLGFEFGVTGDPLWLQQELQQQQQQQQTRLQLENQSHARAETPQLDSSASTLLSSSSFSDILPSTNFIMPSAHFAHLGLNGQPSLFPPTGETNVTATDVEGGDEALTDKDDHLMVGNHRNMGYYFAA